MKQEKTEKILQQTKDIYNRIAPDFANTRNKWWQALGNFQKYAKDGDNILDLGCGNGRVATLFANLKINYLGLDNSEELIKIAQERFKDKENYKFEVGDVTRLAVIPGLTRDPGLADLDSRLRGNDKKTSESSSVKENNFNLVLMIAVLHHLPTKELRLKVLTDIYQLLKSGGTLVLSNWNILSQKKYWPRFLDFKYKIAHGVWGFKDAFIPWKPIGNDSQRYIHSITAGELKKLLNQAGFKEVDVYYENKGGRTNFFHGYNLMAIAKKKC